MRAVIAAALPLVVLISTPVYAGDLLKANFTARITGGNANLKDPLRDPFVPNQVFTGSFVYDSALVPVGPGAKNVAFPAGVPAADAFTLNFGPYVFTQANDPLAMIQYNNGQFRGFAFNTTFLFEGVSYLLNIEGGIFSVATEAQPFGTKYINGTIDTQLTGIVPYSPVGAVPEPATWALMILGFGAIGAALRRRVHTAVRFA